MTLDTSYEKYKVINWNKMCIKEDVDVENCLFSGQVFSFTTHTYTKQAFINIYQDESTDLINNSDYQKIFSNTNVHIQNGIYPDDLLSIYNCIKNVNISSSNTILNDLEHQEYNCFSKNVDIQCFSDYIKDDKKQSSNVLNVVYLPNKNKKDEEQTLEQTENQQNSKEIKEGINKSLKNILKTNSENYSSIKSSDFNRSEVENSHIQNNFSNNNRFDPTNNIKILNIIMENSNSFNNINKTNEINSDKNDILKKSAQKKREKEKNQIKLGENNRKLFIGHIEGKLFVFKHGISCIFFISSHPNSQNTIMRFFTLDLDYSDIFKSFKPINSSNLVFNGLRMLRIDKYECILSFICSSMNNIKRISKMVLYLKHKTKNFTDIENIEISEEDLKEKGFGYRSKFIIDAIKKLKNLRHINQNDKNTVQKFLLNIKGVGKKVCDCILLMGFSFFDTVPIDVHIYRICIKYFSFENVKLNKKIYNEINTVFNEYFGDYAGIAQLYLFFVSLKTKRIQKKQILNNLSIRRNKAN
ncbi:hypothetical protein EDEG_02350 [Edhazardia aedis USNM 41457]|uniref:DNA-(apurinic or apyrimidinic site) lyase n=1 Tax=Edhazardia aedis (strain USNM 41457) TaxID=1003232 RepID=J9D6Y5_EDHAE|nr:hypothetical protein EDEG_02350 [Edhazardia aedis USNM 41457]|eukprot:EJW03284.1 hypothetical protein EDEG_02350 [Edhazardia aedis USNM 41457]